MEMLVTPMKESFDAHKITGDYLAKKIKEEMNYKEPFEKIIVEGRGKNKVTKKIVSKIKTPAAMAIRARARSEAHKLLGHFPPDRKENYIGGLPPGVEPETRPIRVVFVDPKTEG
ncbi:MAG: hypothetical protein ABSF48_20530 [Thermodesulfobacteriota bacterium]